MTTNWPKFELAAFSGWDSVPNEVRADLTKVGVPKTSLGELYRASEEPVLVDVPAYGRMVRFGNVGRFGGIYLDPSTGKVLELIDHLGAVPQLVNTTLEQFTATVKALIEMFPFYEGSSDLEGRTKVADEISAVIGHIDPAALTPDSFWATFVDDVVSGDYSTEDVLGSTGG